MTFFQSTILIIAAAATSICSAQGRGEADNQPEIKATYSWCATRFTVDGLKKEFFYSTVAQTADKDAIKRSVESQAWSGTNSMLRGLATVSTECGSSDDRNKALSARDEHKSSAIVAGYLLKPEVAY